MCCMQQLFCSCDTRSGQSNFSSSTRFRTTYYNRLIIDWPIRWLSFTLVLWVEQNESVWIGIIRIRSAGMQTPIAKLMQKGGNRNHDLRADRLRTNLPTPLIPYFFNYCEVLKKKISLQAEIDAHDIVLGFRFMNALRYGSVSACNLFEKKKHSWPHLCIWIFKINMSWIFQERFSRCGPLCMFRTNHKFPVLVIFILSSLSHECYKMLKTITIYPEKGTNTFVW